MPKKIEHYSGVPIVECGDRSTEIPEAFFPRIHPHPYMCLGAPYGEGSPYLVREGVLRRLRKAHQILQGMAPGWRICIFDAYRPNEVQRFMVEWTYQNLCEKARRGGQGLNAPRREELRAQVRRFWAEPSEDPTRPPPHSTGAALDLTLMDETGTILNMGSPIDECSPRSYPDHFAESNELYDRRRRYLAEAMQGAGFARHPREWWHFSWGDQLWAWQGLQGEDSPGEAVAHYGRMG